MTQTETTQAQLDAFRADFQRLQDEVGRVIVGQRDIVRSTLMTLIAGGHVLLEGVPGLGKTMLVHTLADALQLSFSRIQFTPDLMPADLVGTNVVLDSPDGKRFEFQKGPLFANVVLADEINRATPKTQSALLEAMQEHSVTVGGTTHRLPEPFIVLATQNPLEMEGTYPLPEAQLDRFFAKLLVEFPTSAELAEILDRTTGREERHAQPVLSGERILEMRQLSRQIPLSANVRQHAIDLVLATHPDQPLASEQVRKYIQYGSSPRGAQALILFGRILAILDHRFNVSTDDLNEAAPASLRHRMIRSFDGVANSVSPDEIIADLIRTHSR